jgi:phosphate transport system substrate-binding protein
VLQTGASPVQDSMRTLLLFGVLLLGGCRSGEQPRRLVITGSSTVAPLAAEIGRRFEAKHPGVRVDVQTGGSSRGIADARKGLAQVGMASRGLKPAEADLVPNTIARDGIGVIVHARNHVQRITDAQMAAIYRGELTDWSELDAEPGPITVVHKAEGRSTLELFLEHFKLRNDEVKPHVVVGDNQQGLKTVLGNPRAIGYVSIGAAELEITRGAPLRLLPVGGVAATLGNVRTGRFPLSRPLNLVTLGPPTGLAAEFIEFAVSDAVRDLVEKQYFVTPR